jgi:hypothetical protein
LIEAALIVTVPGKLAEAIPGKVTKLVRAAVNEMVAEAPVVLVAEKSPLILSPAPAQASGSANPTEPRVNLLTVTVKLQLGPAFVEQVTVVVPTLNVLPEAGEQVVVPQAPLVVGAE